MPAQWRMRSASSEFDVTLALDLDRRQMAAALESFAASLEGTQIAALYYSGHALSLADENYLLPVDARIESEAATRSQAIGLTTALQRFEGPSRTKFVILDASRDNPFAASLRRSLSTRSSGTRGLAPIEPADSTIVLSAAAPGNLASDGAGRNSPFTDALVKQMSVPGLDVQSLAQRVRADVSAATQGRQLPWSQSNLTGEVRLGPEPKPDAQETAQAPQADENRQPGPSYYRPYRYYKYRDQTPPEAERQERERLAALERAEQAKREQERTAAAERARQAAAQAEAARRAREQEATEQRLKPVPPPLLPAPAAPDERVARFPTIEAADRVVAGAATTVLVSLTVDKVTPEVTVLSTGGGTTKTPAGALSLPMPADGPLAVKVVLRAAGFDLDPATPEEATIEIDRSGDSTTARFRITARPDAVGPRSLRVTLWRDNEFLANLSRKIEIVPARPVATDQATPGSRAATAPPAPKARAISRAAPVAMDTAKPYRLSSDDQIAVMLRPRPIDLKIEIVYDDAGGLGRGRVTIATDYLGRMRHGEINTPPSIVGWLEEFYREFRSLSSRGAQSADVMDEDTREARIGRLRAFGEELYRRAAPPVLKAALAELLDNPQVELRTVQIYSNNPVIPWELMRAPKPGGGTTDFFGIAFELARWHEDDGPRLILRPPQDQRIDEVVAIAPAYTGGQSLGAQSREIDEIQGLLATRRVSGKRSDFLTLVRNPPRGIIHFAGHGEIAGRSAVERRFAIRLEDGAFDVMDWRGVAAGQNRERALFFFNACDIGQAESVAGAVEGWAPAVLARGAAGYIGGLWPLKDDPAARFAVAFYRAVAKRLAEEGHASVAGALSDARRLVYETADPTYLGYAFYGDAQLALVRR